MDRARIGFEPPDHPEPDEDWPVSEPSNVGSISQLATDERADEVVWVFSRHVYLAVQVGPFSLVIGRAD